ncbi:MAG: T9SS type A sorting domain-containing protein [Flavobacteriaceae bacterium]|nr:T9SS type A sorting domain-containing protein [Flavobacteriaceae bacterium]
MKKFTLLIAMLFCCVGFSQNLAEISAGTTTKVQQVKSNVAHATKAVYIAVHADLKAPAGSTSYRAPQVEEKQALPQPSAEVQAILDKFAGASSLSANDAENMLTQEEQAILDAYYGDSRTASPAGPSVFDLVPCNQAHPLSGTAGGGTGSSVDSAFKSAADIVVPAGENFTIETINTFFLTFAPDDPPITANIVYRADDGGLPGAEIGSETVVPTVLSSQPWANPVADQYETTMAVTPFTFMGDPAVDTTYWIEISMGTATNQGTVFWEYTEDTPVEGLAYAQFDSGTGVWTFPDPIREVVYDFIGDCEPIDVGGGPCNQDHPLSGTAGGGTGSSVDSAFKSAADIVVAAGENFTVETINAYFLTFAPDDPPITANIVYRADDGGLPGAELGSETVVPTILSSQPWANPVADQYETTMSVTPFTFMGDAGSDTTYWIEISMGTATNQGTVFWEYTEDTPVEGLAYAQFDAGTGVWTFPDPIRETVYDFIGSCEPIGGGAPCNQEHPLSGTAGGGTGSSVDSAFKSASDIVVAAGEDFTVETIDAVFLTFAPDDPPITANIVYRADDGGLPGAELGSETVVPTIVSSQPWANPVADQYVTTMSVTPFTFAGDPGSDTTYWIEISMGTATNQGTVFWEYTEDTPVEGFAYAQFDAGTGVWTFPDPIREVVYNYSGTCDPIGGGATEDECIGAIPVACGDVISGDTSDNTDQGGNSTAEDEWYSFTGTGSPQLVTVSLCDAGTTYDSRLTVYDSCGGTIITTNDDFCGLQSEVSFFSDGTSTYYIAVEGFDAGDVGPFVMSITCVDPPANDQCDGAFPIACGDSLMGTTINATDDTAAAPDCDTTTSAPGVWYVYEDTSGLVTDILLDTCSDNTDYDTKISVYTGDCSSLPLTCVAGNDDGDCPNFQSEVEFQSDGNTTYYILVHGFNGAIGNFELTMTCTIIPPANDDIANAIDLNDFDCPWTDEGVQMPGATTEAGNPTDCDLSGANGVWYSFTPIADGFIRGTVLSPAGATSVTFYTAPDETSTEDELVLVDYFDNQCFPNISASIPTVTGQAYYCFVVNTGGITDIEFTECDNTLGTSDQIIQGFSFYPNPAVDVVNMAAAQNIERVEVYNMLGQKVIDQAMNTDRGQLNVSQLNQGTYLMKVFADDQVGAYHIIKQ